MSDKKHGRMIAEFVGLHRKRYSFRAEDMDFVKKFKGVKSSVVASTITFDNYIKWLKKNVLQFRELCSIRFKNHSVYTERCNNK